MPSYYTEPSSGSPAKELGDYFSELDVEIKTNPKNLNSGKKYLVIKKQGFIKWVLPNETRMCRHLFRFWKPNGKFSRVLWFLLSLVNRMLALNFIPAITKIYLSFPKSCDWLYNGWDEEIEPVPFIHVGTAGPTQKVVVLLYSSVQQRFVRAIKIPVKEMSYRSILNEFFALERLRVNELVISPTPIYLNREKCISAQEIPKGFSINNDANYDPIEILSRLKIAKNSTTLFVKLEELKGRLSKLNKLDERVYDDFYPEFEGFEQDYNLPVVLTHGDFKPWNILQHADGRILIIDWEFSESEQIPGMDLIHFYHRKTEFDDAGKMGVIYSSLGKYLVLLGVSRIDNHLLETLIKYYKLWYSIVLLENQYNPEDHF